MFGWIHNHPQLNPLKIEILVPEEYLYFRDYRSDTYDPMFYINVMKRSG